MGGCANKDGPGWLDKISFIVTYTMNSCEPTWEVYVRTGGKALGNLALSLVTFDMADLARSFFRPKSSRSRRHGAPRLGRGKKRIQPNLFPEPSDLIADTYRSQTGLVKPVYSDGINHLWELDNHLQRVLNKVAFVNMATDFAYDWFSGILSAPSSECDIGRFRCWYEIGPWTFPEWKLPVRRQPCDYVHGCSSFTNQILIPEGRWIISAYLRATFAQGSTGSRLQGIIMTGPEENMKLCSRVAEVTTPPSGDDVERIFAVVEGPTFVRVLGRCDFIAPPAVSMPVWPVLIKGFRID